MMMTILSFDAFVSYSILLDTCQKRKFGGRPWLSRSSSAQNRIHYGQLESTSGHMLQVRSNNSHHIMTF
jgi:hypothetical protein